MLAPDIIAGGRKHKVARFEYTQECEKAIAYSLRVQHVLPIAEHVIEEN
jgi:hypothetical protein